MSVAQAIALAFEIPHPPALILNYGAYFRTDDAARKMIDHACMAAARITATAAAPGTR